jgi:hypothetical protein
MHKRNTRLMITAASAAFLALAPAAFAATNSNDANSGSTGVTSGPASQNSTVVPSTKVQKNALSNGNGSNASEMKTAGRASTGTGAPGVAAQRGTEAGTQPQPKSSSSQ